MVSSRKDADIVEKARKRSRRRKIDPVTLEVIYHRLDSIADEMEVALLKSSFSTIVKELRDASTAIFDVRGQTLAQAVAIPIHLGTLMLSVPQILKAFPVSEMKEGDVYIANDPYSGGTHLPDITMVVPVVYRGKVVALTCSMVHHQDIGAITPGVPTAATSLYQEGLNLPPLKFYEAGKPVKVVHDIIRKNVRVPDLIIGDIRAQIAAGNVGRARMLELLDEYGEEVVLAATEQLLAHAESLTRQELEKVPDGSYSFVEYMDNDGVDLERRIKIQATVTVRGSDFIVDFSGTSPQLKGPFNCVPSSALSAACYVLRAITGASIPSNAGAFRPITLNLPEGSMVNPHPPAPVGARGTTIMMIGSTLMGALAKVMPERLTAASGYPGLMIYFGGVDPLTGQEYVTSDIGVGGMAARPTKDGIDTITTDMVNMASATSEALEMNFPIRILRSALHEESGGAGRYRGGLGKERIFEILRGSATVTYRGERHYTQPWGLLGGLAGASGRAFVLRKSGEREEIPSKIDVNLNEGDRLYMTTPGGGGYGDPLKREPMRVLQDVLDGRVSVKAASDDYGVVIEQKSMTIDGAKTEELRQERERLRGPIAWTYDRGQGGRE